MKKKTFSKFEALARNWVEGSFKRLFGGRLEPLEVASQLARVVEDTYASGQKATRFQIALHPADYDAIVSRNPELADELAEYVLEVARQAALSMPVRPTIMLSANPALNLREVLVDVHATDGIPIDATQVHRLERGDVHDVLVALNELDAYVIVSGRQHVALNKPITTFGRRMDNDVVLDNASVSRRHVQIRWRYGRFILYDLSNRGRTSVNGDVVTEHVLQPGDVIGVSDVMLIYGEGDSRVHRPIQSDSDDSADTTQIIPKGDA
ncbi:MAG: DUF3662 domain-containing protein [Chloroflexi bacterium]|nr:DUF3662 domain-containing protein [Chloroflexota bacterium]